MQGFLPVSREDLASRGIDKLDFVLVCGDAYVDHPAFGAAVISRWLESLGYSVGIIAQPDWRSLGDIKKLGRPRLGFLVSAGNIDSMVAHYTAAKKRRGYDYYSPGGQAGLRPDRAVIVYCNLIRQAFGGVAIIIGGLEASLRRFAHYDYWDNKVRRSILADSRADILIYGMGERSAAKVAELLAAGVPVKKIRGVRGTAVMCEAGYLAGLKDYIVCGDYNELKSDKKKYARAFKVQYEEHDYISGRTVVELYDDKALVQYAPAAPLEGRELDKIYALGYMRDYHPAYDKYKKNDVPGVPAIAEVKFSLTHNRGCFGACSFCALAYHQGRSVRSRSIKSVVREAGLIAGLPDFKGYVHDIGGPTANFRKPSCAGQLKSGMCRDKRCMGCDKLEVDHADYMRLIEAVEAVPGVKRVFIRSGIRFDYLMLDDDRSFLDKLVRDNISGQLKVAPEHVSGRVLEIMGKCGHDVYERFCGEFYELCRKHGKEQYLVPYLMSSHPGSRLEDAVGLAVYLKSKGYSPEQVQDFYPTPGTASTCMFYTGLDPFTGRRVYVPEGYAERRSQRALLQSGRPENRRAVRDALKKIGREDLLAFLTGRK